MQAFTGMKKLSLPVVTVVISFLFFASVLCFFLQNDFWQDEVYTLFHFVFVPLHTTLTDYHSTNNHVLFSLLNNIIRQTFGYQHLSAVLLHPYLLRSVPVIIALVTVFIFYTKAGNVYGKNAALIGSSVWLTTFPLICFAAQFRGYSLSILIITLQYFSFIRTINKKKMKWTHALMPFVYTSLSLLCLPTNLYIELSYLLLCAVLFIKPSLSSFLLPKQAKKPVIFTTAVAIAAAFLCTGLYYRWMLHLQPQNELLTTFHPFAVANLLQSLAILYHFAGYRFYLLLLFVATIVLYIFQLKKKAFGYRPMLLPALLFFLPFLFFFVHGSIIIQRTFLSLLPFFVLLIALSLQEFAFSRFYPVACNAIPVLNLVCVVVSFVVFINDSKKNNVVENHQQDLVNHYYLIHFNELQTSLLTKRIVETQKTPLYLHDGFGQTGIDYYLRELHVPFVLYSDTTALPKNCLILTNLKKETAQQLAQKQMSYHTLLRRDDQYNLFVCHALK